MIELSVKLQYACFDVILIILS